MTVSPVSERLMPPLWVPGLLAASIAFWFLVIVGGGSAVILVIGALFGADDFLDAAVFTFMLAGAVALLWLIGTSGHYLQAHHVWPWP